MNNRLKSKEIVILSLMIITFLLVASISLSTISGMRINTGGTVESDKDLRCFWTISDGDSPADINITWYRDGTQNLTATRSCTNSVECSTILGNGTVPNTWIYKGDTWTCTIRYYNGTAIETSNVSVVIDNSPPSTPRIYLTNGSEADNTTFIAEEATIIFDANSTDKDGDTLTYLINDTTFCNITASTGVFTCHPTAEAHLGLRYLEISAKDGPATIAKYFRLNVTSTNDAPRFSPSLITKTLTEGQIFNYIITGADDENNIPLNLTISDVTPYLNLTVNRTSNTTFMISLPGNRVATYAESKFNYTVTLTIGDSDNITYTNKNTTDIFTITGVTINHPPNTSYIVYENTTLIQGGNLSVYFNASDFDNSTLSFSTVSNTLYPISYNSTTDYGILVPNYSFAYGWINLTNLTNNHVVYHNFSLYVYDSNENFISIINMVINNTNDAPYINDKSTHVNNTQTTANLSNMTGYTGILYKYKVNASDIDDITYDRNRTGLGTYSTNDTSNYWINSTTGWLSFTPSTSGNFTFTVTITDNGSLSYNYTAKIEVLPNSNPIFAADITITCREYDGTNWPNTCYHNISKNVTEPDIGDYITSYWSNSSIFTINNVTGIINFTASQSMVGNYSIMINATDSRGGVGSTTINVTVLNTNNPPSMQIPNVPPKNMIVGTPYDITYNASDLDLSLNNTYETLNFTYNVSGPNTSIFTFFNTSTTGARLHIEPCSSCVYEGNYSINVTVTDTYGNKSNYFMTKYIYNVTLPPTIIQITPWGTPFLLPGEEINETWIAAAPFGGNPTEIITYENRTYIFNQTSTADNSSYPNFLDYGWYFDDVLIDTTEHYSKYFNFFSNGTHNITFVATDQYNSSSSFMWQIETINVNRPPEYNPNSIQNVSLPGSGFITSYLTNNGTPPDKRFYDPDDDPTGWGYNTDDTSNLLFSTATSCEHANFTFENARLNVEALSIGPCYMIFEATDPLNSSMSVFSEIILLNITNISYIPEPEVIPEPVEVAGRTVTEPMPIPMPEEVEKPRPLQILTPKLVTTYKNATIKIPIVIKNTWNDTLMGITLEANTNASNVSLYLDKIYIPKLDNGESVEATLYVKNYKSEGHYEIQMKANVTVPEYEDTATIYINSAEMRSEGEELENKIAFARDLLSSNPECQELSELLTKAQQELSNENYFGTAKIVDTVINGCKFLVNEAKKNEEMPERNFIKTFNWKKNYNDYIILFVFGMLFVASLYYILKKDNPEQDF